MSILLDKALELEKQLEGPQRRVVHQLRLMTQAYMQARDIFSEADELYDTIEDYWEDDIGE